MILDRRMQKMELKTINLPTRQIEIEVYTSSTETSENVPAILLLHEVFGVLVC